jgi:hypothetical protein
MASPFLLLSVEKKKAAPPGAAFVFDQGRLLLLL